MCVSFIVYAAVYSFLTLNYLLFTGSVSKNQKESGGLLEMGGASVQSMSELVFLFVVTIRPNSDICARAVCYEVSDEAWPKLSESDRFELDLTTVRPSHLWPDSMARKFRLFAHSWLDFGERRARSRYWEAQLKVPRPSSSRIVRDPCLPPETNLTLGAPEDRSSPIFSGTGDFQSCLDSIVKFDIAESKQKKCGGDDANKEVCAMESVLLPEPASSNLILYATRAFYFAVKFFESPDTVMYV